MPENAKAFTKVVSAVRSFCKCFSISKPENAKAFTKFCKCCRDFVNALAFPKGEMLKHLQDFFVNFTNVNALARAAEIRWNSAPNWGLLRVFCRNFERRIFHPLPRGTLSFSTAPTDPEGNAGLGDLPSLPVLSRFGCVFWWMACLLLPPTSTRDFWLRWGSGS